MESHHELLALAHAEVFAPLREVGLRLGDEPVAHRLDLGPPLRVGEEVRERHERVALALDVGDDAALDVVEDDALLSEAVATASVREDAVVELVGRADPAVLERLRVRVDAAREHAVQTPSEAVSSGGASADTVPPAGAGVSGAAARPLRSRTVCR